MKEYFKRLKTHPGISFGIVLPMLGFFAGASNKNVEWLVGGLLGALGLAVFSWSAILISNFKD